MCAWVGNQQSHGVVITQVRTNAVRSLCHQRRDHQSTYLIPLERLGLILLSEADVEDHHARDGSNISLVSSKHHAQPEEEDPADEGVENEGRGG
jgi:hypothetical protein